MASQIGARRAAGALAAGALVVLATGGCGDLQVQERIVAPASIGALVRQTTGVSVTEQPASDRPSMVNLLATFVGARGSRVITLLVFDGRRATGQALGSTTDADPDPQTTTIRDRNVVVLYRGDRAARRRLQRGLASLPRVPEDRVPAPTPVPSP
jgi:hypothetical protein